MRIIRLLVLLLSINTAVAQSPADTLAAKVDTNALQVALQGKLISFSADPYAPKEYPYNKKRVRLMTGANIAGYGGTMAALYFAWYKNYPQSSFHFFDDNHEWKQVDKVGHAYSAYIASYGSMEMWRWAGLNRKQRIWIGGLSGAVYQTVIETLDGFSAEWGWSWGDFAANVAGSGLLISQELAWNEQRVRFKFSFNQANYGQPDLNKRADKLFGNSLPERMLKDYNAQTYWLSANLKSFFPKSNLPPWLSIAVGYGAQGMFGAEENIGKEDGVVTFNRTDIKRYRQYYIAPDVDLSKIRTNSKVLRTAFKFLNVLKFPTPSLELSNGKLHWNWLHF